MAHTFLTCYCSLAPTLCRLVTGARVGNHPDTGQSAFRTLRRPWPRRRVRAVSDPGAVSSLRKRFTPRLLAFAGILGYLSAVSLSTFVERKDVKEYLRLNVPKPWFQAKAEITAPTR